MTVKEFRAILERLGLTQVAAGRLLGYDERTVRRWAGGERSIPMGIVIVLRLLLTGKVRPEDVARARSKS